MPWRAVLPLLPSLAALAASSRAEEPARGPAFFPLGVYWAGEHTFQELRDPPARWNRIEQALDDLQKHHVNALWLTHLSASDTAEFARRAAKRGICLVASIGELSGEVEHIRKGDHKALIERTLKAWGDAPKPIAWGLGDEPRTAYMDDMARYVAAWRTHAPGEPVTSVVMWGDVAATAAKGGFDFLCCDVYPFFSPGNPNGYPGAPWDAWASITRHVVAVGRRPWMMGQSFQEPWGPYTHDDKGNVVYLKGGAPHWVMPTPEQITWQAWSAVALGAKGIFYFIYRFPESNRPDAKAANLPAAAKEPTNSGSPGGLTYADGRPTPQYEALAATFRKLGAAAAVLAPLKPDPAAYAQVKGPARPGSLVGALIQPQTGARYLVAVAGCEGKGDEELTLTLGPDIVGLKRLASGAAVPLSDAGLFRECRLTLPAGEGEILECQSDPENRPAAYADDFSSNKHATDAKEAKNVKRFPSALHGHILSAANGGAGPDQAFVVYDLDKLLGTLPAGGVRVLMYHGGANPPSTRGAFWFVSDDGERFRELSRNEFGEPVRVAGRYLKLGLSWVQSSAPDYGFVSRFAVWQWRRPAK